MPWDFLRECRTFYNAGVSFPRGSRRSALDALEKAACERGDAPLQLEHAKTLRDARGGHAAALGELLHRDGGESHEIKQRIGCLAARGRRCARRPHHAELDED